MGAIWALFWIMQVIWVGGIIWATAILPPSIPGTVTLVFIAAFWDSMILLLLKTYNEKGRNNV